MEIHESGMAINYTDDISFLIEKCHAYRKIRSSGVSSVECVVNAKKNMIYFVELKTTAPDKENKNDLESYVVEIADKFIHSISLCYSIFHEIQKEDADYPIGITLKECLGKSPKIRFMLLVKTIAEDNCLHLSAMFQKKMRPFLKIWNAESVIVMSGAKAVQKGLAVIE
ncbi:hypothetical protein SAMN02745671_02264 [Anaerovibrio lipolyticus DSM 3074]|uniref:Uncharacterized protein n=1 Tax=Anaerovibrio lipolyticus DSM 3074 TaxID=1120997 RepID=A0A1M6FG96_9FIRM|nr:hypothetical protein [Anaerovibrio lipolyticus]SHI96622.1 hypothetical protein SAMN02745671_02264 [Anaerovibrio lipolyticus DSM 3074]